MLIKLLISFKMRKNVFSCKAGYIYSTLPSKNFNTGKNKVNREGYVYFGL
jgi:hypothetical protein